MSDKPSWDDQFREDDDEIKERQMRRRGRDANLAGKPFDNNANMDWQRGWLDAQDDRELDELN